MSKREMVINYVPGEECRVAMVEDGKLADFHAERMDGPSNHVGSIYVGKVVNVEPAIQAAFIDFGLEHNGFLHVSDVHPQYFPGEDNDKTERVGKKTPRRERPPIQDCFRRGDEVAVQVLKEGVGTKGPTVTSYLSLPGRFLVMMPQMDKVGVSRKVEDEEQRRKMREILDQLDLPDGFGFILRTAGFDRTKAELKRDLAYLVRLWKDMEKRWRSGDKPRLLYSESDLLVRALRDLLTTDLDRVIVDNPSALSRAARFLKIVAPRTSTTLAHYTGKAPIFHATGIEDQIQMIHAREVPLESGGRLVIDEAEALVAIDVNSGKSRDARDSETNALMTNIEAADEICRQLRLRDLGGVIVNDFIDMRSMKNRRDLENRMRDNLKRDRARWTIAPVSEFGIMEMTRQRMRASHESQHFADCPTCRGRGMVQRPDSVATDALRELTALLDHEKVRRVELVVHPRIAGELLSSRRKALSRIERTSGKHVDVRVSEAVLVDRVTFYAYDDKGDLDVSKLGSRKLRDDELVNYEISPDAAENWAEPDEPVEAQDFEEDAVEAEMDPHPIELEPVSLDAFAEKPQRNQGQRSAQQGRGGQLGHGQAGHGQPSEEERGGRRRRRRGRGGRGRDRDGFDGPPMQGQPQQGQQAFDAYGAPIETPLTSDGYNVEDNEALLADPTHATGAGEHHHEQHGEYAQGEQGYDNAEGEFVDDGQGNFGPGEAGQGMAPRPVQYDEFGNPLPDDGGPRRRRRRRRGRRGRGRDGFGPGQPGDNFGPQQPGQFAGQHPGQYPGQHPGQYQQPLNPDENGQYAEQPEQGEYAPEGEGQYAQGAPVGNADQDYDPEGGYDGAPNDNMIDDAGFTNAGPAGGSNSGFDGQGQGMGDGGPRRRRRRRGRRGGGGGPGGGGGGFTGNSGGPAQQQYQPQQQQPRGPRPDGRPGGKPGTPVAPSLADLFRSEQVNDAPLASEPAYADEVGAGTDSGGEAFDGEQGPETQIDPNGTGGPDRPKRRRRRGRGGKGGGGAGQGAGENGVEIGGESPDARAARAPVNTPKPASVVVPARAARPAAAPAKVAPAKPAPKVAAKPEKKPPRTLYATRRRIAPGEIKNTKRED